MLSSVCLALQSISSFLQSLQCILGNKQCLSSAARRGWSAGFKTGSILLGRWLTLNCEHDGLGGGWRAEGKLPALLLLLSLRTYSLITAGVCGINRRGERLGRDLFLLPSHYLTAGLCVWRACRRNQTIPTWGGCRRSFVTISLAAPISQWFVVSLLEF